MCNNFLLFRGLSLLFLLVKVLYRCTLFFLQQLRNKQIYVISCFQCDLLRGNRESLEFLGNIMINSYILYTETQSHLVIDVSFFVALFKHLSLISHQMDMWCILAD